MRADVVDRENIRMVQRGDRARFSLEPAQPVGVSRQGFGQDLDGYVASKPAVPRPVHFPHATRPEGRENFIRSDFGTVGERHKSRTIISSATKRQGNVALQETNASTFARGVGWGILLCAPRYFPFCSMAPFCSAIPFCS